MPERMKNPTISDPDEDYISILIDDVRPANKKGVIIKGQKDIVKHEFKVKKFDELKGELHFCTYPAAELDTDEQFMKSEDIDHMHDDLMKNLKHTRLADINHDQKRLDDVWINEIWKERDDEGSTISSNGVYIIRDNELLMQKAREGKINGVSIMGRCEDIVDEPLGKSESKLQKMVYDLWNLFIPEKKQNKEHDMTKEELQNMTDEQLAEMNLQRIPETPAETPEPEVPQTEEPEVEKANDELETLKSEKEAIKKDLDDLIEKHAKLSTDFDTLKKSKVSSDIEPSTVETLEQKRKAMEAEELEKAKKRRGI